MIKHSWTHVKTGGQYIVLGSHWDAVKQCPRVDYQSVETGMRYSRTWNNFKKRFTENENSSCDVDLAQLNHELESKLTAIMDRIHTIHPDMTPIHNIDYLSLCINADRAALATSKERNKVLEKQIHELEKLLTPANREPVAIIEEECVAEEPVEVPNEVAEEESYPVETEPKQSVIGRRTRL